MAEKQKGIKLDKHTAEFICEICDAELIVDFEERDKANQNQGALDELKKSIGWLTESYKAEDKKMWELKDDIENHKYCKGKKNAFEDVLKKVESRIAQFEKEVNTNGNKTD